jgi:hypothetical protein
MPSAGWVDSLAQLAGVWVSSILLVALACPPPRCLGLFAEFLLISCVGCPYCVSHPRGVRTGGVGFAMGDVAMH